MADIPTKDNVEVMRETFPQKDEPAPDPENQPDAANAGAFKLMAERTPYKNEFYK